MDTLLKIVAAFVVLAMLRHTLNDFYGKASREFKHNSFAAFLTLLLSCGLVWSLWFLGLRV